MSSAKSLKYIKRNDNKHLSVIYLYPVLWMHLTYYYNNVILHMLLTVSRKQQRASLADFTTKNIIRYGNCSGDSLSFFRSSENGQSASTGIEKGERMEKFTLATVLH